MENEINNIETPAAVEVQVERKVEPVVTQAPAVVADTATNNVGQSLYDDTYIKKLREENKKHRLRGREANLAKEQVMIENNEFKALADAYKARIDAYEEASSSSNEKLQNLEKLANNWIAYETAQDELVQKRSENISETEKMILSSISDVSSRIRYLDSIEAKVKPIAPDLHNAANVSEMTLDQILNSGKDSQNIKSSSVLDAILGRKKQTRSIY